MLSCSEHCYHDSLERLFEKKEGDIKVSHRHKRSFFLFILTKSQADSQLKYGRTVYETIGDSDGPNLVVEDPPETVY